MTLDSKLWPSVTWACTGAKTGARRFSQALNKALCVVTLGACCACWPFSQALITGLYVMNLGPKPPCSRSLIFLSMLTDSANHRKPLVPEDGMS